MNKWSKRSKDNLKNVHHDLVKVFDHVLLLLDITVVCGMRTDKEQADLYAQGRTLPGKIVTHADGVKKKSKHQRQADGYAHAVDVYPFPIDLSSRYYATVRFYFLAGIVKAVAQDLYDRGEISHLVRWGGDWDRDNVFGDQSFNDIPHFEIYKP